MSYRADFGAWEERRQELEHEAEERRLAAAARSAAANREQGVASESDVDGVEVRWGMTADEEEISSLLELNGMPRWVAFEERFIVAEKDGEILAVVRYRTESKRLVLGMFVADPWAGERTMARALYAGAAELTREMGAREVLIPAGAWGYPGEAGYRRWGRGWRLDVARRAEDRLELPARGWRRAFAMLGLVATPFFRAFDR